MFMICYIITILFSRVCLHDPLHSIHLKIKSIFIHHIYVPAYKWTWWNLDDTAAQHSNTKHSILKSTIQSCWAAFNLQARPSDESDALTSKYTIISRYTWRDHTYKILRYTWWNHTHHFTTRMIVTIYHHDLSMHHNKSVPTDDSSSNLTFSYTRSYIHM